MSHCLRNTKCWRMKRWGVVALLVSLASSAPCCWAQDAQAAKRPQGAKPRAPVAVHLVAAEKSDKQIVGELTDFVESEGDDGERRLFDAVARMLGMSVSNADEAIRQMDAHLSDAELHTIWIRRASGVAMPEILLIHVVQENDVLKTSYFLTSSDGKLKKAAQKVSGKSPQFLVHKEAGDAYHEELTFWRNWAENHRREKEGKE